MPAEPTVRELEPAVAKAQELGHTVEWDPPAALTRARRWTCTCCGATVLDYCGNVYGSAVEMTCQEYTEFMRPIGGDTR